MGARQDEALAWLAQRVEWERALATLRMRAEARQAAAIPHTGDVPVPAAQQDAVVGVRFFGRPAWMHR